MTTTIDGSLGITYPAGGNPQAAESLVIQVVQGNLSTVASSSSSSLAASGLSATITPKFSTSKMVINWASGYTDTLNNGQDALILIKRGGSSETLITLGSGSYTDSTVSASTTYYYIARSVNALSQTADSSYNSVAIPAQPVVGTPSIGITVGSGQLTVSWSATNASTYNVLFNGSSYDYVGTTTTSYTKTGLSNGTQYYLPQKRVWARTNYFYLPFKVWQSAAYPFHRQSDAEQIIENWKFEYDEKMNYKHWKHR